MSYPEMEKLLRRCIDLSPDQIAWAKDHAAKMQHDSRRRGSVTSFGNIEGTELFGHFIGACGELAWCIYFNKWWPHRIGNYEKADIGERVQVRTRSEVGYQLRCKPKDNPGHAFFHAIFQFPNIVDLKGWQWGYEVKAMPLVDLEIRGVEKSQKRNKPVHLWKGPLRDLDSIPKDVLDECPGPFRMPDGMK